VVIGGTLLTGGAGSLGGTLAGVLLLKVIQNLINQVGTLNAYYQQVVSGTFLLVVVLIQSRLTRRRTR
jgi:ribose/xylose/arabinose/galactoside ABC-type transport system permease subunit